MTRAPGGQGKGFTGGSSEPARRLFDLLVAALPAGRMAVALGQASNGTFDWHALRAQYVDAASADRAGGSLSTGVRHWLRFCLFGRHVSPVRGADRDAPLAAKLAEEALLMDFVLWLVLANPTGKGISVETAAKYVSTVKAWHERKFGCKIGADLELTRLREALVTVGPSVVGAAVTSGGAAVRAPGDARSC